MTSLTLLNDQVDLVKYEVDLVKLLGLILLSDQFALVKWSGCLG